MGKRRRPRKQSKIAGVLRANRMFVSGIAAAAGLTIAIVAIFGNHEPDTAYTGKYVPEGAGASTPAADPARVDGGLDARYVGGSRTRG
ncbi:hypothetical protein ERC79_08570 [Rhodococcus sp. ABRD24]|uniref:hypothetical protein n=1 Tax=Rhodococcus sp. ABRD24 TaxID=2507582 RepID=UPI00103ACEE5|nr:hypothetical protein [Rhodococcus sp. ABRD24]QBJ96020.1 hypothetical protein ERC79_08570 [Rhodococcus sp. ABRD24]